jgi:hypothetical protein
MDDGAPPASATHQDRWSFVMEASSIPSAPQVLVSPPSRKQMASRGDVSGNRQAASEQRGAKLICACLTEGCLRIHPHCRERFPRGVERPVEPGRGRAVFDQNESPFPAAGRSTVYPAPDRIVALTLNDLRVPAKIAQEQLGHASISQRSASTLTLSTHRTGVPWKPSKNGYS